MQEKSDVKNYYFNILIKLSKKRSTLTSLILVIYYKNKIKTRHFKPILNLSVYSTKKTMRIINYLLIIIITICFKILSINFEILLNSYV